MLLRSLYQNSTTSASRGVTFFARPPISRPMSSLSDSKLTVQFTPDITFMGAKALVPISYARYMQGPKETAKYDRQIGVILDALAQKLASGEVTAAHILLTGGLQEINWPKAQCDEIEATFRITHKRLLAKQSKVFAWDEFIEVLGKQHYSDTLERVTTLSGEGTEWHRLMQETFEASMTAHSFAQSLDYQRAEYSLLASAAGHYTHVPYLGPISKGWSYIETAFPTQPPPLFCRIEVQKVLAEMPPAVLNQLNSTYSLMLQQAITSENYPKKCKAELFDLMLTLLRTYAPDILDKPSKPAPPNSQETEPTATGKQPTSRSL